MNSYCNAQRHGIREGDTQCTRVIPMPARACGATTIAACTYARAACRQCAVCLSTKKTAANDIRTCRHKTTQLHFIAVTTKQIYQKHVKSCNASKGAGPKCQNGGWSSCSAGWNRAHGLAQKGKGILPVCCKVLWQGWNNRTFGSFGTVRSKLPNTLPKGKCVCTRSECSLAVVMEALSAAQRPSLINKL